MAIGDHRHRVRLVTTGVPVPDGDGGYTEADVPLDPAEWDCSIVPASAKDLESITSGTVIAQASHLVRGRFHPGLTTKARMLFDVTDAAGAVIRTRTLNVVAVVNREERSIWHDVICAEVVD